jgi:ABC-2 type transport system permease protein
MMTSGRTIVLVLRQACLIAYTTGILWLRRHPMSMAFAVVEPLSLLFVLILFSEGENIQLALAGSLILAIVGTGLAVGEDISYYKTEVKFQDYFVASPVSPLAYMIGIALSDLLFDLPALVLLSIFAVFFVTSIVHVFLMIPTILLVWGMTSAIGFFLSSYIAHMRRAEEVLYLVEISLAMLPPVFYSIEYLPQDAQYFAYAVPTTHASLMLQHTMGFPTPPEWSPGLGIGIQLAYFIGFVILAKAKAIWTER